MKKKQYDVCVVGGCGHVGLPLSIAFADKGKNVVIFDINNESIESVNSGKMPFIEKGADEILQKVVGNKLIATNDISVIGLSKYIVIIIGTPVDEHLNPYFGLINDLIKQILPHLNNDQTIILRSTVFPGSTEKIRNILQKEYPSIEVCFCPERIAEGKAMEELYTLPQIVSGFDKSSVEKVNELFKHLTDEIIVTTPLEAELSKLFTNSWRYIQFATANQFYMIAKEFGADFYSIFNSMTKKYPRTKSFPRPGFAAGPCLFKDTMQISAFTNNKFFLGHSAMLINEGLPNFIVEQLKNEHTLSDKTVGILGMAFKAESDDKRESLSYKLKKILEIEANDVLCSDVYVEDENFVAEEQLITKCDIIVIGAPHSKYFKLDFSNTIVYDVWNITNAKNKIS
jgi:UDP-N-acetyl-D-mannosaminuronic acid dehydrogenase